MPLLVSLYATVSNVTKILKKKNLGACRNYYWSATGLHLLTGRVVSTQFSRGRNSLLALHQFVSSGHSPPHPFVRQGKPTGCLLHRPVMYLCDILSLLKKNAAFVFLLH